MAAVLRRDVPRPRAPFGHRDRTQIGFAISGFLPSIAVGVTGTSRGAWLGVAIFTAALCLVNVIAVATGRETYRVPTDQLGLKEPAPARNEVSAPK